MLRVGQESGTAESLGGKLKEKGTGATRARCPVRGPKQPSGMSARVSLTG